jgi:HEAT repeat protein
VSVFFFRNKLSRLAFRTKGKRQELAPIISNFLFHSSEDPKQEQKEYVELKIEIREYLNNRPFRKIISQILFDLQKDVAGGTRERLFKLYKELELHHDAFKKLQSWRWETVAQGILELSQMEVEESHQLIRKFINDRRGVVRKQAELATVSLRPDGIDYLLDTTRNSISEWQQLKLIEVLGKRKNYRPPQFKGWLLSQNKDVVLFALRLIKHYNQKGAEPSINQLVKHKNDEIKIAAIQCIVDFNFTGAVAILKTVFWKSSNTVKINILNAIAVLGSEDDIGFLQKVAKTENSFIIVGKAQSTINAIAPETILPSKDILNVKHDESPKSRVVENTIENDERFIEQVDETVQEPVKVDLASIEVEDIEFFDEVEFPEPKTEEKSAEPFVPAFELNSIEEEYGSSMDHLLGLVSSKDTDMDSNDLRSTYDSISTAEKSKLVGMMGESADERELPLLEHITENEVDSELRFHAFKTIKSIQKESDLKHKDSTMDGNSKSTELPNCQQSIFYSLYHHTDDLDARLILLKELMEVGDQKELPFLNNLLSEENTAIKKMAQKAIDHLCDKVPEKLVISDQSSDGVTPSGPSEVSSQNEEVSNQELEAEFEKDNRIPLELFLLYEELGIESSKRREEKPSIFDFDLSEEFFLETDDSYGQLNQSHE